MNRSIHFRKILCWIFVVANFQGIVLAQHVPLKERWLDVSPGTIWQLHCPQDPNIPLISIYREEFNTFSLDKWFWHLANVHNSGSLLTDEANIEENLVFQPQNNGTLHILIEKEPITIKGESYQDSSFLFADGLPNLRTWPFRSGFIASNPRFYQGRFELRCKVPHGHPMWPAFWLFGRGCGDEIDIFEFQEDDSNFLHDVDWRHDRRISQSVHSEFRCKQEGQNPDTESNWSPGKTDMTCDFHVYAVEWNDFTIKFFVDGILYRVFPHYWRKRAGIRYPVLKCDDLQLPGNFKEDPQFTISIMEVLINGAVRKNAPDEYFPNSYDLDYFEYFDRFDCNADYSIRSSGQLKGLYRVDTLGDNAISYRNILIEPFAGTLVQVNPDPIPWNPGPYLFLSASEEIIIKPGFDFLSGGNLVAQIKSCDINPILKPVFTNDSSSANIEDDSLAYKVLIGPEPEIEVYPNPAFGDFTIDGLFCGDQIKIYSAITHPVYEDKNVRNERVMLSCNSWPAGIYFIQIERESELIFSEKFVVLK